MNLDGSFNRVEIEGEFWLNDLNPYEPTEILFKQPDRDPNSLDCVLSQLFGVPEGGPSGDQRRRLRVTIERME